MIPTAIVLNIVFVPSLYRCWINQNEYMPTAYDDQLSFHGSELEDSYLGCNTHDEQVCQLQRVISNHAVLQCGDNSNCGVQGVAEEEVSCEFSI